MNDRPTIFVGSVTEAEEIDRDVRATLEILGSKVKGWRDVFKPGDYTLDTLLKLAVAVDGALLIVTPDDLTRYRGRERMSPRDNILLEIGLFLAHLGKRRTGILHVKVGGKEASLPIDLRGLTTLVFDAAKRSQNELQLSLWLKGVKEELELQHPALPHVCERLRDTFNTLPAARHDVVEHYIIRPFVEALKLASRGQIVLTPGQYYEAIDAEMQRAATGWRVMGVATLSSEVWHKDQDQRTYIARNFEAAQRKADIRRVFIVSDQEWHSLHSVVREQLEAGILIRRARQDSQPELLDSEDMVIFVDPAAKEYRTYVADHAFYDSSKIRRGRLIFEAKDSGQMLDSFNRHWAGATVVTLDGLVQKQKKARKTEEPSSEPGARMKSYWLAKPVVTCEEAAIAKVIPLKNELKTLLLATSKGFVAAHLPGDSKLALRTVKKALEIREACLATPDELVSLGLQPGTVCAVKDPVWSLPHLISNRVLEMDMVSTNNGTEKGFYRFHPGVLLQAAQYKIGDFEDRTATDKRQMKGRA